nr:hypothetical protein [uncultured Arsenicibacter sp.]
MKNQANIGFSTSGCHYSIDCRGKVEYQIGPAISSPHHVLGRDHPVHLLTITALETTEDIKLNLPLQGEVVDCGSGIMLVLSISTNRDGTTTVSGRCPTREYYDRAAREQMLRTAAERFQMALAEREAVSNRAPVKASVILAEHFR